MNPEEYKAHIEKLVDEAPPLTPAQLQHITAITGCVLIPKADNDAAGQVTRERPRGRT